MESYPDIASIGDIGKLSDISSLGSSILSPDTAHPGPSIPPSPLHARSDGKAKKTKKDRETFYKVFGVVYLPGDINGFAKKLYLLAAEFFAGNTIAARMRHTSVKSIESQVFSKSKIW